MRERVVHGTKGKKIVLLEVSGVLSERQTQGRLSLSSSESMVARIREQLELAAKDDDVRALLVRIHSPGGTVTASEIIHGEILRFKEETGVPVVAQMMGTAASGGYYVAMTADHVQAYPTTVTGSIGVIFAGLNVAGLLDKVGAEDQSITTGAYKDAGSPLRPMRDEEREQLSSVLDDLFERFLTVVDTGRPGLELERIRELSDGRIYSAEQALEAGLIDSIGDLPAAVTVAKERAGLDRAQVVVYRRPGERRENLFSMEAAPEPELGSAMELLAELARPSFLYLWSPGR